MTKTINSHNTRSHFPESHPNPTGLCKKRSRKPIRHKKDKAKRYANRDDRYGNWKFCVHYDKAGRIHNKTMEKTCTDNMKTKLPKNCIM